VRTQRGLVVSRKEELKRATSYREVFASFWRISGVGSPDARQRGAAETAPEIAQDLTEGSATGQASPI